MSLLQFSNSCSSETVLNGRSRGDCVCMEDDRLWNICIMHIYIYIYIRVRMCVCTFVRMYVCMYVRTYVCMHVRMYVCIYCIYCVCTHAHTHKTILITVSWCSITHTHTCICTIQYTQQYTYITGSWRGPNRKQETHYKLVPVHSRHLTVQSLCRYSLHFSWKWYGTSFLIGVLITIINQFYNVNGGIDVVRIATTVRARSWNGSRYRKEIFPFSRLQTGTAAHCQRLTQRGKTGRYLKLASHLRLGQGIEWLDLRLHCPICLYTIHWKCLQI
jgi:hypothetical protein